MANFATFVSKTVIFPPKIRMNLISNQLSTASMKYLNWQCPVFEQFQNGCNKVVIEPCVVQFWSEIMLVISNGTRTHAHSILRSCILFQPKLRSTQFNYHYKYQMINHKKCCLSTNQ